MSIQSVTIPRWFDRHLHIRDGKLMEQVLPHTLRQQTTGAIIMPNLAEPITTVERAFAYRKRIEPLLVGYDFVPCMTLYLTDHTDPREVVRGYKEDAWRAVKLYMADQHGRGGTTGSAHGVRNLAGCYPVFEVMEQHGIPLLGHFEAVEADVDEFDREVVSVERDLAPLLKKFPGLTVVFEHLTDGRAAEFVADCDHDSLYATVTAHHLLLDRNALFAGGLNPGHYCKPVLKRNTHQRKVREYVTSGHHRFGAGTDSAPHDVSVKSRCYGCAAGIFTAPAAVEMYTTVFDEDGALPHLATFLAQNFLDVYGMKESHEIMTLERTPWVVPERVGNVPVLLGGHELPWKLVG